MWSNRYSKSVSPSYTASNTHIRTGPAPPPPHRNRSFCSHNNNRNTKTSNYRDYNYYRRRLQEEEEEKEKQQQQSKNEELPKTTSANHVSDVVRPACRRQTPSPQMMDSVSVAAMVRALTMSQNGFNGESNHNHHHLNNQQSGADDEDFQAKIMSRRQCVIHDATHFQQIINERKGKLKKKN